MSKYKQILLLFTCSLSIFLLIGCSKTKEYTKFQNAYFELSNSEKSFSQDDLESLVEQKVSMQEKAENEGDFNAYIFEVDDEQLKVFLNDEMKLSFVQYSKLGELTLTNSLEKDTSVGEYKAGFTSEFKLDSLEDQQKIFDEINN